MGSIHGMVGGLIAHIVMMKISTSSKISAAPVVIIPVPKPEAAITKCRKTSKELKSKGISVKYDTDENQDPDLSMPNMK